MIIRQVSQIEGQNPIEFSWFSLRAYHNTKLTAEQIIKSQNVPKKHFKNTEKQAEQIRFFLLQAREYFEASRVVTLVTRPVLLYYSAMCLATAEFLFKQTGDSSLDRARENHRHHGLVFSNRNNLKTRSDATIQAAAGLIAQPAIRNLNERFGTFDLWHQSARSYPLPADHVEINGNLGSQIKTFKTLAIGTDKRLSLVSDNGITLLTAIKHIPGMISLIRQFGEKSSLARGFANSTSDEVRKQSTLSIGVHPGDEAISAGFFDRCRINANDSKWVEFQESRGGGVIWVTYPSDTAIRFNLPESTSDRYPNIYWSTTPEQDQLNEFGFIYIALYIVGNYARYYPDHWVYDVEKTTQLGMVIEKLLNVAEQRIGLLTLSELAQVYYVPV